MESKNTASPDWLRWKKVERLELWEAASLSLNIEPRSIAVEENIEKGGLWYRAPKEFQDLLHQLVRSDGLPKENDASAEPTKAMVKTRDYLEWARKRGQQLPSALQDVTTANAPGPNREGTLLTIIGALVRHSLHADGTKVSSQAGLIDALFNLTTIHPRGLSKSTLEDTFSKANKAFDVACKRVEP